MNPKLSYHVKYVIHIKYAQKQNRIWKIGINPTLQKLYLLRQIIVGEDCNTERHINKTWQNGFRKENLEGEKLGDLEKVY